MFLVDTVARAIDLTVGMAWETWWALVLGLTLSGLVEVFVAEERMTAVLGDDGAREAALGAAFGAASSSCSYSAVGTSKTLFKKGASGVASLGAFLFASTDLVVELGLVLWVLLGVEFVAAEFVGGVVAVAVLATLYRYAVPDRWFDAAREHVRSVEATTCAACGMEADLAAAETATVQTTAGPKHFCCGGCEAAYRNRADDDRVDVTWREKARSPESWREAAAATVKDWDMLWEDVALGFVLAGVVGAVVPSAWWVALFGAEAGLWWVVTNSVVAAVIGALTFMCSVGNVPFALVLWTNGLPFGSVLSFIYADLIIPPLVGLYRTYYGTRLAAVLTGSMFLAAVVAGVVVHYLFGGLGLIPAQGAGGTLDGGYTTALNLALTPVFLGQLYLAYGPERIAAWLAALPGRLRSFARRSLRTAREVDDALAAFLRETARAAGRVGRALALAGRILVLLGSALATFGAALARFARRLYDLVGGR